MSFPFLDWQFLVVTVVALLAVRQIVRTVIRAGRSSACDDCECASAPGGARDEDGAPPAQSGELVSLSGGSSSRRGSR